MMASRSDRNKIYLTEQEAERIQNTVKARLRKCAEAAGHVRNRRDPKAAISQATGASLMADMGGAPDPDTAQTNFQGDLLPVIAIGQPYPPSSISLRELKPMQLSDLRIETHHRGCQLIVKRASPVVVLAARSWTMVQDEEGEDIERLEICLHKSRHEEDVLESATRYAIKEPYFTFTDQGEATIRIDHLSDLTIYRDGISNNMTQDSARECKERGNQVLKQRNKAQAHAHYTEGLKIASQDAVFQANPGLAQDISRNRCHVNLLLGNFDEARDDALASLTSGDDIRSKALDSKAYFRAACAANGLAEYEEAKSLLIEQLKLTPPDQDGSMFLRKIETRLQQQKTGRYEFEKIRAGISKHRARIDTASFLRNTEVRDSPGCGRGLFAINDIATGEIIMCEKAFCVVWGHESEAMTAMTFDARYGRIRVSPVGLTASIVRKLLGNPSQIPKVMNLYGGSPGHSADTFRTEEGPVVDVFQIHDIMSRNAFGPSSPDGEEDACNASTGLWIRASYINHSCIPNAKREFIGDLMVLRAYRPIAAGEEILQRYDESRDFDARQTALMTTWGFECYCPLCAAERIDSTGLRRKREQLAKEADAFIGREHWAGAKRVTIVRAERLARAIEDTYDRERYSNLPREANEQVRDWIAKSRLGR